MAREILSAPVYGTVISKGFNNGDTVEPGDTLLIMECMKMQFEVTAGSKGRVKYYAGLHESVQQDDPIAEIEIING